MSMMFQVAYPPVSGKKGPIKTWTASEMSLLQLAALHVWVHDVHDVEYEVPYEVCHASPKCLNLTVRTARAPQR